MTLVSRPTLKENIHSLRLLGIRGFAIDPTDENSGESIDFESLPAT